MEFYSKRTMYLYSYRASLLILCASLSVYGFANFKNYRGGVILGLLTLIVLLSFSLGSRMRASEENDKTFLAEILAKKNTEIADPRTALSPPPYLDPSHPRYSAKLAAAVLVWEAMEDESLRRGKMPKDAMTAWLEKHYKSLNLVHKRSSEKNGYRVGDMNNGAIGEVAKICNWEVDGGSPTTPGD